MLVLEMHKQCLKALFTPAPEKKISQRVPPLVYFKEKLSPLTPTSSYISFTGMQRHTLVTHKYTTIKVRNLVLPRKIQLKPSSNTLAQLSSSSQVTSLRMLAANTEICFCNAMFDGRFKSTIFRVIKSNPFSFRQIAFPLFHSMLMLTHLFFLSINYPSSAHLFCKILLRFL